MPLMHPTTNVRVEVASREPETPALAGVITWRWERLAASHAVSGTVDVDRVGRLYIASIRLDDGTTESAFDRDPFAAVRGAFEAMEVRLTFPARTTRLTYS